MRITNQMLTNNMMNNINKNMNSMNKYDEMYSTGKKIQRPSDDPIIAVRALKLRTNLSQLNQYVDKNIPDALAWMDVTESALKNVNQLYTDMNTYCVDGSNDHLTVDDRNSIIQNLCELRTQVYQEGNANYVGRSVFTGYKTDSNLTFNSADALSTYQYQIKQDFKTSDLESVIKIVGSYDVPTTVGGIAAASYADAPTTNDIYRVRLAYGSLGDKGDLSFSLSYTVGGTTKTIQSNTPDPTIGMPGGAPAGSVINKVYNSTDKLDPTDPNDPGVYANLGDDEVRFIADTGEVIFGKNIYNELRTSTDVNVTYDKLKFENGDLRPEHFFTCSKYELGTTGLRVPNTAPATGYKTEIDYVQEDQKIEYEINFGQSIAVNVQARDAFSHDISRDIEELKALADDVTQTEKKIDQVKKLREDGTNSDAQNEALDKLAEQLNTELVLKNNALQKGFESAITSTQNQQRIMNIAVADLGSRYGRVQLTEERLKVQKTDFTDLLSSNEDADVAETYINLSMAQMIYNCSLNAASKAVSNTLLDFI